MSFADLNMVTFGLQEYTEDIHFTMFFRASLRLLLQEAGLRNVNYIATSKANGLRLEMEILAYKLIALIMGEAPSMEYGYSLERKV